MHQFNKAVYPLSYLNDVATSIDLCDVLVATDYFTKWTEVVPLKNMTLTHKEVIEFITEHIIHRFGIPQTLTTD
jgi:hypothetical protein